MMEILTDIPVTFTPGAIGELRRLMVEDSNTAGKKLRVGVKGGGCSGMTYVLNFDAPEAEDRTFDVEGVPCIINPAHEMYLYGMEIDWQGGLNSRGLLRLKTGNLGHDFQGRKRQARKTEP